MAGSKALAVLGCRGVPVGHGGFETFARHFAPHMARRGWDVSVYCRAEDVSEPFEDWWNGVRRVHIPASPQRLSGKFEYNRRSLRHALQKPQLLFWLGYDTAVLGLLPRLKGFATVTNMDGIEWKRGKWSNSEKAWLWLNERLGCWFSSRLIADHPEILRHLNRFSRLRKITMTPYGADRVDEADPEPLAALNLAPRRYALAVARAEPENSIREIVSAWSQKKRGMPLVILGNYGPEGGPYQRLVRRAAGGEVLFPGPVYDPDTVRSLRFHCALHIHGHRVGGTNPSLVEALGAGSPVLAHDNPFNRWTAGSGARFFSDEKECEARLDALLADEAELKRMRRASYERHAEQFEWEGVLAKYDELLSELAAGRA